MKSTEFELNQKSQNQLRIERVWPKTCIQIKAVAESLGFNMYKSSAIEGILCRVLEKAAIELESEFEFIERQREKGQQPLFDEKEKEKIRSLVLGVVRYSNETP